MKAIKYSIKLLEPLLIRIEGSDPNTMSCGGYIPGSAIRGAVIAQYQKYLKSNTNRDASLARRLFFSNQTCFLNAYPATINGNRTVPVPLSFKVQKHDNESPVYDESATDEEIGHQTKSPPFDFCSLELRNASLSGYTASRSLSVHIDRGYSGAPDDNDGTVFNFETMQEGQTLCGLLIAWNDEDMEILEKLLKGVSSLGSSKGGGHGRVKIEAITSVKDTAENLESESQAPDPARLVMTLTAHSIWRNSEGLAVNSASTAESFLSETIEEKVKIMSAFAQIDLIGGFNRKWRLPIPGEYALSPGCVFVIEAPSESCRKKLLALRKTGIGERLNEGFGRFCIDMHGKAEDYKQSQPARSNFERNTIKEASPAFQTATLLVNKMARTMLERKLRHYIENLDLKRGDSSKSQVNNLRNVTEAMISEQATGESASKRLQEYLDSINKRQNSRNQFEKVKINNQPFRGWLQKNINLLKEASSTELLSTLELSAETLPAIGDVKAKFDQQLVTETHLKLIHEVLVRLVR